MNHRGAESVRVARPLFQAEGGGSTPTSALQLIVDRVQFSTALALNALWHSTLPRMGTGFIENQPFLCYAAEWDGIFYSSAIWSQPVARLLPQQTCMELRRFAITPDAPRFTASRVLSIMTRLIRLKRPEVTRLVSYQDCEAHDGTIYRAAGWHPTLKSSGGQWARDTPKRRNPPNARPGPKQRWELAITAALFLLCLAPSRVLLADLPVVPTPRPTARPTTSVPATPTPGVIPTWTPTPVPTPAIGPATPTATSPAPTAAPPSPSPNPAPTPMGAGFPDSNCVRGETCFRIEIRCAAAGVQGGDPVPPAVPGCSNTVRYVRNYQLNLGMATVP